MGPITDDTIDLFGKTVSDLQENVTVSNKVFSGTSKYVTGYTAFSSKASEQQGNYIAIHVDADVEGCTIKVNGSTLDSDGDIVLIIPDNARKVNIVASKEGYETTTEQYNLSGLTLLEPEAEG